MDHRCVVSSVGMDPSNNPPVLPPPLFPIRDRTLSTNTTPAVPAPTPTVQPGPAHAAIDIDKQQGEGGPVGDAPRPPTALQPQPGPPRGVRTRGGQRGGQQGRGAARAVGQPARGAATRGGGAAGAKRVRGGRVQAVRGLGTRARGQGAGPAAASRQQHQPRRQQEHRDLADVTLEDLFADFDVLRDTRAQTGFLGTVREKLENNDYYHAPNTNPNISSDSWDSFDLVFDSLTQEEVGAVVCVKCSHVLTYRDPDGTSSMRRHVLYRCGEANKRQRPPATVRAKAHAKLACARACTEHMLSFESLTSEGVLDLLQVMVDIGNAHGPVDVRELIPDAHTLSTFVKSEADRVRRDEALPKILKAMEEGGCAATVDGWTEDHTKQHYLTMTVHFINSKWILETEYLLTVPFDEKSETGAAIKGVLLQGLVGLGIPPELVEKITFVSDNGANVVKALEEYYRLYCIDHALNICTRSGMSIKYHELLGQCLQSSGRAMTVLTSCDEAVRLIKAQNGRDRRLTNLKRALRVAKKHFHSYIDMLLSLRARFDEVKELVATAEQGNAAVAALPGIESCELDELIQFLDPLDFDGTREASSDVTTKRWPELVAHCQPQEEDSAMIAELKSAVLKELPLMELVRLIENCKRLVQYLKQSELVHQLTKSVKQEIEVRWNSILTLLQSIDDVWDEISEKLQEANQGHRLEVIDREQMQLVIKFLKPFKEEATKLEGEEYPSLCLALLATKRLGRHCEQELVPEVSDGSGDDFPMDDDLFEVEQQQFQLLRRNVAKHLQSTVRIDMKHKLGTLLHPTYRRLLMLPLHEREEVFAAARAEIAAAESEDTPEVDVPAKRGKLDAGYDDWSCDASNEVIPASLRDEELTKYLRDAKPVATENLLQWWKTEGAVYPGLQALAKRILAIPATSGPAERVFSNGGFIVNPRRTRLSPATLDAILFLHQYLKKRRRIAAMTQTQS